MAKSLDLAHLKPRSYRQQISTDFIKSVATRLCIVNLKIIIRIHQTHSIEGRGKIMIKTILASPVDLQTKRPNLSTTCLLEPIPQNGPYIKYLLGAVGDHLLARIVGSVRHYGVLDVFPMLHV